MADDEARENDHEDGAAVVAPAPPSDEVAAALLARFEGAVFAESHGQPVVYVERAAFAWTDAVILRPHEAYRLEPALREALKDQNEAEIVAGTRWLDMEGRVTRDEAIKRLLDHQIAELGMFVSHMDGIGRAMTTMPNERAGRFRLPVLEWLRFLELQTVHEHRDASENDGEGL